MDSECRWWGIIGTILVLGIAVVGVTATVNHRIMVQNFIEAGYTQTTLPGSDYGHWVKSCGE